MNQKHRDSGYEDFSYPDSLMNRRDLVDSPVKRAVRGVLKRPWLVVATFFIITIPAMFYFYNKVPIYSSRAVIALAAKNERGMINIQTPENILGDASFNEEFYITILESNTYRGEVADKVVEKLPNFNPDSLRLEVFKGLNFEKKPRSQGFIIMTGNSQYPEVAQLIASVGISSLENQVNEIKRSDAKFIVEYVDKLLLELNDKLADLEAATQDFLQSRKLRMEDVDSGLDSELRTLEQQLSEAEAKRDLARMQIDSYTAKIEERLAVYTASSGEESNEIRAVRGNLARLNDLLKDSEASPGEQKQIEELLAERKEMLRRLLNLQSGSQRRNNGFGSSATQVSLNKLEAALEEQLLSFSNAQIQCAFYQSKINQFLSQHPNLPNDILEYLNFKRSKDVIRRAIDILVEKRETARIQMASETGGIKVIDAPQVPGRPVPERIAIKLIMIILGSLVLGVTITYVIDYFDTTVQSEREVAERYNLSVFGSVPVLDTRSFRRQRRSSTVQPNPTDNGAINLTLLDYHTESSPVAEAYRSLRTSLKFLLQERKQNVLVISSSVASEGKTLTTYNLGMSFAQGGSRVLIIDLDLRRASQHKLFSVERHPGITDHLLEEVPIDQCYRNSNHENLKLIPAGRKVNNPADLLSSKRMNDFLDEVSKQWDIVLIDTPPISPCMDSRNLASYTGGLVLITRAEMTKHPVLEHCIDLCRRVNVNVLGVVVNHASFRYSYGYYYVYQRTNPYGYYYSGYQYYYSQDAETGEKVKRKKRQRRREKSKSS